MAKDLYEKWVPLGDIPPRLFCEAIHDDYEGFRILLKGEKSDAQVLRIAFDLPLFYRNIDEGSLLRSMKKIPSSVESSLYVVNESSLVEWFMHESAGVYEGRNVLHYAIITPNDCVDVLSEVVPVIEWIGR